MAHGATSFRLAAGTVVAADPGRVERFLLDPGCLASWHCGISGDIQVTTPVLQPGTALELTAQAGHLRLPYTTIVSEHLPGRKLAVRTTRGVIDLLVDRRRLPEGGGTRIDARIEGAFHPGEGVDRPARRAGLAAQHPAQLRQPQAHARGWRVRVHGAVPLTRHRTQDPPPEFL